MGLLKDRITNENAAYLVNLSDEDEQLLLDLEDWRRSADMVRKPFNDTGLDARRAYAGELNLSSPTPFPPYNLMYNIGNNILSRLAQSIPVAKITSKSDEPIEDNVGQEFTAEELAASIQSATDDLLERTNMELFWIDLNTTFVMFNGAYFLVDYQTMKLQELFFSDVWIDPVARTGRINELARYVIYREVVSRSQLASEYDLTEDELSQLPVGQGGDFRASELSGRFTSFPNVFLSGNQVDSDPYSFLSYVAPDNGNTILRNFEGQMLTYDDKYETEVWTAYIRETDSDADNTWRKIKFLRNLKILSNEAYQYEQCPVVYMSSNRIGDQLYSPPMWNYLAPFQQALNFWWFKIARNLDFGGDPVLAIAKEDDPANQKRQAAKDMGSRSFLSRIWRILPIIGKFTPQWLSKPALEEKVYEQPDKIIFLAEKLIGMNDIMQGIGKQQGQRTAFEVQTLLQEGSPRLQLTGRATVYAMKEALRIIAEIVLKTKGIDWNEATYSKYNLEAYLAEQSSTFKRSKLKDFLEALAPLQAALGSPAQPLTKYAPVVPEIAAKLTDNSDFIQQWQELLNEAQANPSASTAMGSGMSGQQPTPVPIPEPVPQPDMNTLMATIASRKQQ